MRSPAPAPPPAEPAAEPAAAEPAPAPQSGKMAEKESESKRRRVSVDAADAGGEGAGGEGNLPSPQVDLMSRTPAKPPTSAYDPKDLTMSDQERLKLGLSLPDRDFGPADTKLWTKVQV